MNYYDIQGNYKCKIIESFDNSNDMSIDDILKLKDPKKIIYKLNSLSSDILSDIIKKLTTTQIIILLQKLDGNQLLQLFSIFSFDIHNFIKLLRPADIITIFRKLNNEQRKLLIEKISNGEHIPKQLLDALYTGKVSGVQLLQLLHGGSKVSNQYEVPIATDTCQFYSCNDCYNSLLDVNMECANNCNMNCSYYKNLK